VLIGMRAPPRSLRLIAPVFLLCALLGTASAQSDDERARQLFDEGHAASDRGDHAEACRLFTDSLALSRRGATLLNLGACHDKLGKLVAALDFWRQGVSELAVDDKRRGPAEERIAALEQRVPRLRVEPPSDLPAGTEVRVDGAALTTPEIALDPGRHEVVLVAPGHADTRVVVQLAEASREVVKLDLGPSLVAPAPPPAPAQPTPLPRPVDVPTQERSIPIWVWPVGGVGIAAAIAGIPFAVDYEATLSRQEELCGGDLEACNPTPPGSYDPADDNDRKRRDAIAGTVLASAGGLALLAAVIGAIVGERDDVTVRSQDGMALRLRF
jgi:hypothetical protein